MENVKQLKVQYHGDRQARLAATVDVMIDDVLGEAVKQIEKKGAWTPTVTVIKDETAVTIPLPFEGDEEKAAQFTAVNRMLDKLQPDAAVFVSECWVVIATAKTADPVPDIGCMPSQHPERVEALVAVAEFDYGNIMVMRQIDRSGETPCCLPSETMRGGGLTSMFDGIFRREMALEPLSQATH